MTFKNYCFNYIMHWKPQILISENSLFCESTWKTSTPPPKTYTFFPDLLLGLLNISSEKKKKKKSGSRKNYDRKRGVVGGTYKNLLLSYLLLQMAFTKFYDALPFHFGTEALVIPENILKHFSYEKGYFHDALLLQAGGLMAFSQKPLVERFPMPFSKLERSE